MIKIENLHKSFENHDVLKGISTTINEKEVIAVIGPSGSGKSTFLRCINFLEKPSDGIIKINGEEVTEKNIRQIRQNVGMGF